MIFGLSKNFSSKWYRSSHAWPSLIVSIAPNHAFDCFFDSARGISRISQLARFCIAQRMISLYVSIVGIQLALWRHACQPARYDFPLAPVLSTHRFIFRSSVGISIHFFCQSSHSGFSQLYCFGNFSLRCQ